MYFREVTGSSPTMSKAKRLKMAEPKRYEKTVVKFPRAVYIERWDVLENAWSYCDVQYKSGVHEALNTRSVEMMRERMKNDDE